MSDEKSDGAAEVENGDDGDWLAEFSSTDAEAEQPVEGDDFTWMATEAAHEAAEEEAPDWLSEIKLSSPEAQPVEALAGSALNWLGSDASVPDDDEVNNEFEPEADAEDEGEMPDWLSELEPGQPQAEATTLDEETNTDTEFAWLSDEALGTLDSAPDAEAEAEVAVGDAPDWLSELEPEAESSAESEAEPEVVPNWLSELEPEGQSSEPEPEMEAAASEFYFGWLNDEEDVELEAEAVAGDAPDWLTALEPEGEAEAGAEAEPAVEAAVDDGEFTWMTDEALATPEAEGEAVASDDLDWLSELEPEQASIEAEDEAAVEVAVDDSDFAWMTEEALATPEDEGEAVAEVVPDWLSELEPEADAEEEEAAEPEADTVGAQDSEFTWMMNEALTNAEGEIEPESEDEGEVVAGDVPDWLS